MWALLGRAPAGRPDSDCTVEGRADSNSIIAQYLQLDVKYKYRIMQEIRHLSPPRVFQAATGVFRVFQGTAGVAPARAVA